PTPTPTPTPKPPNFIVIMGDDLEAKALDRMPRLQSLLTNAGLTFNNSFVTTPLCCPSRASFLTGQYAHNHGNLSNGPPRGGYQAFRDQGRESSTLATWLKAAGYKTVLLGKYLNQFPEGKDTLVPPGWDEWYGVLEDRRAELSFYSLNDNGVIRNFAGRDEANYQTDVLLARSLDFIRRAESNDDQPFFLFLGVAAPHVPAVPADRHKDTFGDLTAPRSSSFNEEDVTDKPAWLKRQKLLAESDIDRIDAEYSDRQRSLQAVDEAIGKIFEVLEATQETGNTYVFFTSDNGLLQGQHRLKGKDAPYEESIRVPLIVRGPGVPAGASTDLQVTNLDLAPTLAKLGRATAPDTVDGRSLDALLSANPPSAANWRKDFLIEFLAADGGGSESATGGPVRAESVAARFMPDYVGVRAESQTYVEYATDETELYDLKADPDQVQNLTTTGGAEASTLAALRARVAALKVCKGASCRN
ncbi:MAG TPA: sulfatase, partial [Vicinamibacteria bacterium]|nr:sulfatase [Vicinamibacteria bacterium]